MRKMNKLIGLMAILLLTSVSLFAQKNMVKVKKIQGCWEVSEEITMKQAEERALLEAKKAALREAGVMEDVWSVFGQISQENGTEFHEAYSQMSVLAIGGMINVTDKKVEEVWNPDDKRLYKVVTISATVKKGEEADRSYVLDVKGLEPIYREGENLTCKFKVHGSDSYLKLFWFDETGGSLLYPNDYEKKITFKAEREYSFPLTNTVDFVVEKKKKSNPSERINIMIVATKSDIPFVGEVTYPRVLEWIYSIPANQRCSTYDMVTIK